MQTTHFATEPRGQTDWNAVNWRQAYRHVRALRQRIFKAEQQGQHRKVRSLQKLLLRSTSNTLVSVRQVTQINAGRNTPGVDGIVVKTPEARGRLVDELLSHQPWKARPTKRVYIPKANGKQRPLGIPTIRDRAMQAVVKNALEPQWEARFEEISYGFRPGRSTHDAIVAIITYTRPKGRKRWVIDADIEGAFDNITHDFILKTIKGFPGKALIGQWLKAGYLETGSYHKTLQGTPQGGVISPLLLNIVLHGMETMLGVQRFQGKKGMSSIRGKCGVIRYADDFVIFCETREDAETTRTEVQQWLAQRGLRLAEAKTRILHTTEGFDFLGFTIRLHEVGTATRSGYKLLVKPSKKATQRLRDKLKAEWLALKGIDVHSVVKRLNPIIRGWANYYRFCSARTTFHKLDHWLYQRAMCYAKHMHPHKSAWWRVDRYFGQWHKGRNDQWVFGDKQTGTHLLRLKWTATENFVKVKYRASPDDPALRDYWTERNMRKQALFGDQKALAQQQGYCCPVCGESLLNRETLQIHHIILNKHHPERNKLQHCRLIHLYCHQQIHSSMGLQNAKEKGWICEA